jgi:hypothetical protein
MILYYSYLSILSIDVQLFGIIHEFIYLFIGIFSLLLLLLSISSYRKTRLNNLLYAAGAFGLFAVRLFIEAIDANYDIADDYSISFLNSSITLGILILFFLAIVKRNKIF